MKCMRCHTWMSDVTQHESSLNPHLYHTYESRHSLICDTAFMSHLRVTSLIHMSHRIYITLTSHVTHSYVTPHSCHIYESRHSFICHTAFLSHLRVTSLTHMWHHILVTLTSHVPHSWVPPHSWETTLTRTWNLMLFKLAFMSHLRVTSLTHMWPHIHARRHSFVRETSFICVTCSIHTCNMNHL